MGSRLTLFHKLSAGLPVLPEATIAMVPLSDEARQAELEISHRNAEQWCREARRMDMIADSLIDQHEAEPVASAILKAARSTPSLIAMAAESSRLEAQILGSVTRRLLRESPDPVWVIHPHLEPGERIEPDQAQRRRAA
jgi:nucleotide-binding universal stress UspA family protein